MRHSFLKIAKSTYYFFFFRLAYLRLRRRGKSPPPPIVGKINIVCRYGIQNGLSNGANYHALSLEKLGYCVRKVDVTPAIANPLRKITCDSDAVFIFHCAAPAFLQLAWPIRDAIKGRRLIGYFAWELAEPPTDWPDFPDVWDEIWTTSQFSAQSLAKLYRCPIHVVPHVLFGRSDAPRQWHKGTKPLTFLTMADARSSVARKNPAGSIAAFLKAFPKEADVALIIKLQVTDITPEVESLLKLSASDPRICIITDTISRAEVDALFTRAHVYISLHRAEGFGLPLLEARLAGLATIATGWSGNMDFMTAEDSVLVPYKLVKMIDEGGVYGEVIWADPDIEAAAAAMKHFYDAPDFLAKIAGAGWAAVDPEKQLAHYAEAIRPIYGLPTLHITS